MFNINDYYLGVILAHPDYFNNPNSKIRCFNDPEADPFYGLTLGQSLITGVVVLLKRNGNCYSDYDYSLYKNELCYELNKTNSLGICLAYVAPFSKYYKEKPTTYTYEDSLIQPDILEKMAFNHSYYVMHSKLTKEDAIVINDCSYMNQVRDDYLKELLGDLEFNKMKQKVLRK